MGDGADRTAPAGGHGFGHGRHMDPDAHPTGRLMTMVADWGATLAETCLNHRLAMRSQWPHKISIGLTHTFTGASS